MKSSEKFGVTESDKPIKGHTGGQEKKKKNQTGENANDIQLKLR